MEAVALSLDVTEAVLLEVMLPEVEGVKLSLGADEALGLMLSEGEAVALSIDVPEALSLALPEAEVVELKLGVAETLGLAVSEVDADTLGEGLLLGSGEHFPRMGSHVTPRYEGVPKMQSIVWLYMITSAPLGVEGGKGPHS